MITDSLGVREGRKDVSVNDANETKEDEREREREVWDPQIKYMWQIHWFLTI